MRSIIHSAYFSKDRLKTSTHHHDCHQIIFILKGEVEITVNGEKYSANDGNIALFSRYENHSVTVLSDKYERFILRINPLSKDSKDHIFSLLSNRPEGFENIIKLNNISDFKNIFERILEEHNSNNSLKEEMETALINQLLIMILRTLPAKEINFENVSFNLVTKLQHEFETNYQTEFSLKTLAEQYNISVSSLSHQFKRITGVSVMDYLLSCRLAAAKNLLAKTDKSIGEIVESCGFSDNSNFSRTFKKLNQMSPSEFRRKYSSFK